MVSNSCSLHSFINKQSVNILGAGDTVVKERDQGAAPVESAVYREDIMNKGMNTCTSLEFCDFQASASSFVSVPPSKVN